VSVVQSNYPLTVTVVTLSHDGSDIYVMSTYTKLTGCNVDGESM